MLQRLPLFVLPIVLYPRAYVPLHVFEPRYRQMIARCLEYDKRFGLLFHRADLYGSFQVEVGRVGCIAEIQQFRPLPDGRSLLVSQGIDRFQIADGIESSSSYHEALVEIYEDRDERGIDLVERRRHSIELFRRLVSALVDPSRADLSFDPRTETSFELAGHIEIDTAWQQALLESRSESERLDQIDEVVHAALRWQLGGGPPSGPN